MSLTRVQAIDEMLAIFKAVWDTTSYANRVKYDNVSHSTLPNPTEQTPWVRVSVRHGSSEQATLSGPVGTRRFRREGILTAQLFIPIGVGLSAGVDYAKIIQDAFEGVTSVGGVIFRGVRTNEIGESGDFFQINILTDFEYDEVK